MNRKKVIIGLLVVLLPVLAFGQGWVWEGADSSEALVIRYVGGNTATATVAAAGLTLADGDASSTVTFTNATMSIDTLIATASAITNAAGKKVFQVSKWMALGSDVVSNQFITATNVIKKKQSVAVCKWDTSTVLHYDVMGSWNNLGTVLNTVEGGRTINRIAGDVTGTGNVTLRVYADDDVVYQKAVVSPTYALPAADNGTNITTNTAVNAVYLNEELGIRVKTGDRTWIRALRATTATTGGIGIETQ